MASLCLPRRRRDSCPRSDAQSRTLKGKDVALDPSGSEQLAFWITALAPLLFLGGIMGAYLEFKFRSASAGNFAHSASRSFFLGHYLAGLAGWEVVALFVL